MFLVILVFIIFSESVAGFVLLATSFMKLREPKRKRVITALCFLLFYATVFLGVYFGLGIPTAEKLTIPINILMMSTWFIICSGDRFFVSLFIYLTQFNIFIAINCISDACAKTNWLGIKYSIQYLCIRGLIQTAVILLLFKFVRPRFRRLVDALDGEWKIMTLVPLAFLVLQIFLLYYPIMHWHRPSYNWYMIIATFVLFFVVYYVIAIQATALMEKHALEERELLMAQQNKLWELQLSRQKAAVIEADRKHHDMRHHSAVIMDMLGSNNLADLKDYMQSYNANIDEYIVTTYCSNPTVNSILNAYSQRAIKENIIVDIRTAVPETIGIDSVDLTGVFANAFENAIEGCMWLPKGEKRQIIVTAKYINDRLRIQVENTCKSNIGFNEGLPVTEKKGGGTGTKSIVYTAEKYDGMAGFSVKEGKFYTQIVLNTGDVKAKL